MLLGNKGLPRTVVALLLALAAACPAQAMDVYFGGFAFAGEARDIARNYPYSKALATPPRGGQSELDRALSEKLAGVSNPGFTLQPGLGKLGPDSASAVALGFVLDHETVSVEKLADSYKIVVVLSAQALFFDYNEKVVLAAWPVSVQYIDNSREAPGSARLGAIVRDLYVGALPVNIFDDFRNVLSTLQLNLAVTRRIQVSDVGIGDDALPFLPEGLATSQSALKASVAQDFSKYLSLNQGIPVLPYIADAAIRGNLAARFANGDVFNLKIPEADYTVSLRLEKLIRKQLSANAIGATLVYGAFLGIKAQEPLSGKTYIDTVIKNGASKLVPVTQESVDDWPAFQETLLSLMDKFTRELSDPSRSWADTHAGDPSVARQLKEFKKVVESCK